MKMRHSKSGIIRYFQCGVFCFIIYAEEQIIVMKISKRLKAKNKQATILCVNSEDKSASGNVFMVGKGQNSPMLYICCSQWKFCGSVKKSGSKLNLLNIYSAQPTGGATWEHH